jgi:hypothetical protein
MAPLSPIGALRVVAVGVQTLGSESVPPSFGGLRALEKECAWGGTVLYVGVIGLIIWAVCFAFAAYGYSVGRRGAQGLKGIYRLASAAAIPLLLAGAACIFYFSSSPQSPMYESPRLSAPAPKKGGHEGGSGDGGGADRQKPELEKRGDRLYLPARPGPRS